MRMHAHQITPSHLGKVESPSVVLMSRKAKDWTGQSQPCKGTWVKPCFNIQHIGSKETYGPKYIQ